MPEQDINTNTPKQINITTSIPRKDIISTISKQINITSSIPRKDIITTMQKHIMTSLLDKYNIITTISKDIAYFWYLKDISIRMTLTFFWKNIFLFFV